MIEEEEVRKHLGGVPKEQRKPGAQRGEILPYCLDPATNRHHWWASWTGNCTHMHTLGRTIQQKAHMNNVQLVRSSWSESPAYPLTREEASLSLWRGGPTVVSAWTSSITHIGVTTSGGANNPSDKNTTSSCTVTLSHDQMGKQWAARSCCSFRDPSQRYPSLDCCKGPVAWLQCGAHDRDVSCVCVTLFDCSSNKRQTEGEKKAS